MYISETFGLFSVPLSKASFCVTLLRLTVIPWQRKLLWFIIITIQLTFYAGATMTLVQCDPPQKLWDMALPGKCWDNRIVIYFCIFVGGKRLSCIWSLIRNTEAHSLLRSDGLPPCNLPMAHHSQAADETARKMEHHPRDESGVPVSCGIYAVSHD